MAALRQLAAAAGMLSVALLGPPCGCGDALAPYGYRGEPLFSMSGQVVQFQDLQPEGFAFKVGMFWIPDGKVEGIDVNTLVEQRSASIDVAFPATFDVRVFQPPSASMLVASSGGKYGIALLLVYEDRDGNGHYTPGLTPSELVGGSDTTAIVYVASHLDASTSPTASAMEPGFHRTHLDLLCGGPVDAQCDVPMGAQCVDDADCGFEGFCLNQALGYTFPGGYCSAENDGICDVEGTPRLATQTGAFLLAACTTDAECRSAEGYGCDSALGACLPTAGPTATSSDCGVALGAACRPETSAADCGSGEAECVVRDEFGTYPDGYCALPLTSTCEPDNGGKYSVDSPAGDPTHWFAMCVSDASCRPGYLCDGGALVCVPDAPAQLFIDSQFLESLSAVCVD